MSNRTQIISRATVSQAWADIFDLVMNSAGGHVGPLIVELEVPDGQVQDDRTIRALVDDELKSLALPTVHETSALIFDWNLWNQLGKPDIKTFSDFYLQKLVPRLLRRNRNRNGRGTYFQRMVEFTGLEFHKKTGFTSKTVNQLERILEIWETAGDKEKHPRHSALQATIFDPAKDHHGAAQCGFPCLQQVSFDYLPGDRLRIHAYYPTQYVVDRAYGNYLGLCHLGCFMAHQMGLTFDSLTCFVASAHLGGAKVKKTPFRDLQLRIHERLSELAVGGPPETNTKSPSVVRNAQ
jgi:thymidylate synthase